MLVEFSVKNFRSIKDKVTLSLVASSSDDAHPENTFTDPSGKIRLLKTAAIYGANASGKSNVVKAMGAMRHLILKSHELQRGDEIRVTPFALDAQSVLEPTEFEVIFVRDDMRYVYGFRVDCECVHEEWLTQTDLTGGKASPRVLFQRERRADGSYEWDFKEHWRPKTQRLSRDTNDNTLFLAKAVQNNHALAAKVFDWFRDKFRTMSGEPEDTPDLDFTASLCDKDTEVRSVVRLMLKDADLGIDDFTCEKEPLIESRKWLQMPEEVRKRILSDLGAKSDKAVVRKIVTKHLMADGITLADFDLNEDESDGTQRLFALAGPFIHSMMNGHVLFCDELDSSLHPMLTRALVDMVHQHPSSVFQFIFTTHDCSLLDADLFRRDQVWFTEKNKAMSTDLYSLWDIKPRSEENFRKGYMNGRYGAIPFLGEFTF